MNKDELEFGDDTFDEVDPEIWDRAVVEVAREQGYSDDELRAAGFLPEVQKAEL